MSVQISSEWSFFVQRRCQQRRTNVKLPILIKDPIRTIPSSISIVLPKEKLNASIVQRLEESEECLMMFKVAVFIRVASGKSTSQRLDRSDKRRSCPVPLVCDLYTRLTNSKRILSYAWNSRIATSWRILRVQYGLR